MYVLYSIDLCVALLKMHAATLTHNILWHITIPIWIKVSVILFPSNVWHVMYNGEGQASGHTS